MYVAKKERRISDPVVLKICLDVLLRPGILFSDVNATKSGAVLTNRPNHVRFDAVKVQSAFDLPLALRKYYQAEVLIPSPVPPEFITFPKIKRKSSCPSPFPQSSL